MSTVYLAIQLSVGREVALKVMSPALNADPIFSERFQREANIVGQLSHPNIVAIYDIGRYRNLNYIAMDYLPNGSLHEKISEGIDLSSALRIMIEMATALEVAHKKGYIHRDMKPENILFRSDGTAVLTDFGVAKTLAGASKMTSSGTVAGTPYYMSPEQARGSACDGRSDFYSLGVVFYELLAGDVPYKANDAVSIAIKHLSAPIPKLPEQFSLFQPILNRLMSKTTKDRFQHGSELISAINQIKSTLSDNKLSQETHSESTEIKTNSLFKVLILTFCTKISHSLVFFRPKRTRPMAQTQPNGSITEVNDFAVTLENQPFVTSPSQTQPNGPITDVNDFAVTLENEPFVVPPTAAPSAQTQPVKHSQFSTKKLLSSLRRITTAVILFSLIWGAMGMAITRFDSDRKASLPEGLVTAGAATNDAIAFMLDAEAMAAGAYEVIITVNRWLEQLDLLAEEYLGDTWSNSIDAIQGWSEDSKLSSWVGSSTNNTSTDAHQPQFNSASTQAEQYYVTFTTLPKLTHIKLLNSETSYASNKPLVPGKYQVEISKKGYDTQKLWVTITHQDVHLNVTLMKSPVIGEVFQSALTGDINGPSMVIIDRGEYTLGSSKSPLSTPERRITIEQPFAVGQYEISYAQYTQFTHSTGRPTPVLHSNNDSVPITGISWNDAVAYTQWLTRLSGKPYRLLSESEWEYIARAGSKGDYWWGDHSAEKKANCRRGCASNFSNSFKTKLAPIGHYKGNDFNVYDTAGNVAEWTQDCFKESLSSHPSNGKPVTGNCSHRSIRGGSMLSRVSQITNYHREGRSSAQGYKDVGFRIAMDLYQ